MKTFRWIRFLALAALTGPAASVLFSSEPLPAQFELPAMKTSIYIGSITLTTSAFEHTAATYTATYEARVSPWAFWSESGSIKLTVTPEDYARLGAGETIELTGEATNHKGKPRQISARVQPTDSAAGSMKVRIAAGGTKLIFNGTYRITDAPAPDSGSVTSASDSPPR